MDLVGASVPSYAVEVKARTPEVCEEEEIADVEEQVERYYGSLDLSGELCEDLKVSDWPEGWQEERIWGDLSPEERRSLRRLLASRAAKWMDT